MRSDRVHRCSVLKFGHRINILVYHVIGLTINGEPRSFQGPLTVAQLIERLELTGKRIALERNGEIVPRGRFAEEPLGEGDQLEIVVAVGGG